MKPFTARLGVLFIAASMLAACSANSGSLPSAGPGLAQPSSNAAYQAQGAGANVLHPASDDYAAAQTATDFHYHIFPTYSHWKSYAVQPDKTKVFHPADLHYYGGPLMKKAIEHDIYVNCPAQDQTCWGAPEAFFKNLTSSTLVGLLTQYTKAKAKAYVPGTNQPVAYQNLSSYYYDNDLFTILHTVAKGANTRYVDEYHIFLPQGANTCFDGTNICYSPKVPSTFAFCAYHGSVLFKDIGIVTFSVEPFQNVPGCKYPNLPSGMDPLTNATDSTLAHETFESITDPNPNTFKTLGWYNIPYNGEIGDLCDAFPTTQKIGALKLFIQTMYSNKYHGCADGP